MRGVPGLSFEASFRHFLDRPLVHVELYALNVSGALRDQIGEPIGSSAESLPMTISYPTATCQALVRVSYALFVRSEPLHWFRLQAVMKKSPTVARTTANFGERSFHALG